mgnify:CR=1 FL=1
MDKWEHSKKGIFLAEGRKWVNGIGWKRETKELTIIGETEDSFVYAEQTGRYDTWGIPKQRLIQWEPVQLELF